MISNDSLGNERHGGNKGGNLPSSRPSIGPRKYDKDSQEELQHHLKRAFHACELDCHLLPHRPEVDETRQHQQLGGPKTMGGVTA